MSVLNLIAEEKNKCYPGLNPNKRDSAESVYSSASRVTLLHKRGGMGSSTMLASNHSLGSRNDRTVTQRVLSAKMHRVRQLQNQLADAHYHLSELSNENRVLRAMQKKQETALQRYEDSNAELPMVLNSHSEEVRVLRARYKQLRQQYKQTTDKLKEREMELQQLRDEHRHLLELSKDRNLPEREKMQAQVADLTEKIAKQNEMVNMLERRLTLEARNFKHQLHAEIMKHKDTRRDLDMAINNADKLSSIIEMKERILNNGNGKRTVSNSKPVANQITSNQTIPHQAIPHQTIPHQTIPHPRSVSRTLHTIKTTSQSRDDNVNTNSSSTENDQLSKLCENSRYISSALSQDDNLTSDGEMRSRSALTNHSRTASSKSATPVHNRKSSSDEAMIELAKNVQDGISDMMAYREEIDFGSSRDEIEKQVTSMKSDLLNKIKTVETASRKTSAVRKVSSDSSVEEIVKLELDKSRSQSRKSSGLSFKGGLTTEDVHYSDMKKFQQGPTSSEPWTPPETVPIEAKLKSGKSLENYCKGIMQDIEKSSKTIDQHMKEYSSSRFDSEHLVKQLQTLDKMNVLVNDENLVKLPNDALEELNNNFKSLTSEEVDSKPVPRKRSITGAKSVGQRNGNAFGDASMSNQDLLNDLLGKNT